MPTKIKASISLVAIVTAFAFAYLQHLSGKPDVAWVAVGTGIFAVVAMWVFPEAKKEID